MEIDDDFFLFKKPNSELVIFGKITFESDLPKRCFKYAFNATDKKPIDYYQCATCNLKCIVKLLLLF